MSSRRERLDILLTGVEDLIEDGEDFLYSAPTPAGAIYPISVIAFFFDRIRMNLPPAVRELARKYNAHWNDEASSLSLEEVNRVRAEIPRDDRRTTHALLAMQFLTGDDNWPTSQNGVLIDIFLDLRQAGIAPREIAEAWTATVRSYSRQR